MKTKIVLTIAFVAVALFALAACGNDGRDSRLVGSWVSTVNDFFYELDDDGTGVRGTPGATEEIRWTTEGNDTFIITIGVAEERWSYLLRRGNVYFTHPTTPGYEYPFTRP